MDPRTEAFRLAERALFDRYGLEVESRFLDLRDPPLRTRVLEIGEGPPMLPVHEGGAFGSFYGPLPAGCSKAISAFPREIVDERSSI